MARASQVFEKNEVRDLFYRAATELVRLALEGEAALSPAEAVAVLLQTWNVSYYRFRGGFTAEHFEALEHLVTEHLPPLRQLRPKRIETADRGVIEKAVELFAVFEPELGAVGAAKTLHLFAPRLCPLWDNKIAAAYDLRLGKQGTNEDRYRSWLGVSREQARALAADGYEGNPLKALDEYNYCHFTQGWI